MKVKMISRHTAPSGAKLEQGLVYDLLSNYASELIDHGLAILFIESPPPGFADINLKPMRSKTGRFQPRGKKK
jgi:hypothetical protein